MVEPGILSFYLDGELRPIYYSDVIVLELSLKNTRIGTRYNGGYDFYGSIDEVRIYNREVSESEIQDLFQEGQPTCEPDYNGDGVVNGRDLAKSIHDLHLALTAWKRACWKTRQECGDYNQDGKVNRRDIRLKREAMTMELRIWMKECWLPEILN
jgi:hypothetical protein